MVASPLVRFKTAEVAKEFAHIRVPLQLIVDDFARFCNASGYELVITDALSSAADDARLGRVSNSHQEGRAVDFRIKTWPEEFIVRAIAWLERVYGHKGAISKSDGKRRLVVRHNVRMEDGTLLGDHCHLQISR
jgi:hypothetical protein